MVFAVLSGQRGSIDTIVKNEFSGKHGDYNRGVTTRNVDIHENNRNPKPHAKLETRKLQNWQFKSGQVKIIRNSTLSHPSGLHLLNLNRKINAVLNAANDMCSHW